MGNFIVPFKKSNIGYFPKRFYMAAGVYQAPGSASTSSYVYDLATHTVASAGTLTQGNYNRGGNAFNQYFGINWKYGGDNNTSGSETLNFSNNTWIYASTLGLATAYFGFSTFNTAEVAYCLGGAGGNYSTSVSKVNMSARTVGSGTAFSTGRYQAAAGSIAEYGVMTNGETATSTYTNNTQVMRFSNDTWAAGGAHATAQKLSSSAASAGSIYVTGGDNGSTFNTATYNYFFTGAFWNGSVTTLSIGRASPWTAGFSSEFFVAGGYQSRSPWTVSTSIDYFQTPRHGVITATPTLSGDHLGSNAIQTDFGYNVPLFVDYTDFRQLSIGHAYKGGASSHVLHNLSNDSKAVQGSSNFPTSTNAVSYSGKYGGYVVGGDTGSPVSSVNRFSFVNRSNATHSQTLTSAGRTYGMAAGDSSDNVYIAGGVVSSIPVSTTEVFSGVDMTTKTTAPTLSSNTAFGTAISFQNRIVYLHGNGTSISTNSNLRRTYYFASRSSDGTNFRSPNSVRSKSASRSVYGLLYIGYNASTPVKTTVYIGDSMYTDEGGPTVSYAGDQPSMFADPVKTHLVGDGANNGTQHSVVFTASQTTSDLASSSPYPHNAFAENDPVLVSHPSHLISQFYTPKTTPVSLSGGYGIVTGGTSLGSSIGYGAKFDFAGGTLSSRASLTTRVEGSSASGLTFGLAMQGATASQTGSSLNDSFHFAGETCSVAYTSGDYNFGSLGFSSNTVLGSYGGVNGTSTIFGTAREYNVAQNVWTYYSTGSNRVQGAGFGTRSYAFFIGGGTTYSSGAVGTLTSNMTRRVLASSSVTTADSSSEINSLRPIGFGANVFGIMLGGSSTKHTKMFFSSWAQITALTALASNRNSLSANFNNNVAGILVSGPVGGSDVTTSAEYRFSSGTISTLTTASVPKVLSGMYGLCSANPATKTDPETNFFRENISFYEDSYTNLFRPGYADPLRVTTGISGDVTTITEDNTTNTHSFGYWSAYPDQDALAELKFSVLVRPLTGNRKVQVGFSDTETIYRAMFTLTGNGTVFNETNVVGSIEPATGGFYKITAYPTGSGSLSPSVGYGPTSPRLWLVRSSDDALSYAGSNVAELEFKDFYISTAKPFNHYTWRIGGVTDGAGGTAYTSVSTITTHASLVSFANRSTLRVGAYKYMSFGGNLYVGHTYGGYASGSESIFNWAASTDSTSNGSYSGTNYAGSSLGCDDYDLIWGHTPGNQVPSSTYIAYYYSSGSKVSAAHGLTIGYLSTPVGLTKTQGLLAGGWNSGARTEVSLVNFSARTFSTLGTGLSTGRYMSTGAVSATHAYILTGDDASTKSTVSDKFAISNQARTSSTAVAVARGGGGPHYTGNRNLALLMGGAISGSTPTSTIHSYNLSAETTSTLSATLSTASSDAAALTTEPGHLL